MRETYMEMTEECLLDYVNREHGNLETGFYENNYDKWTIQSLKDDFKVAIQVALDRDLITGNGFIVLSEVTE